MKKIIKITIGIAIFLLFISLISFGYYFFLKQKSNNYYEEHIIKGNVTSINRTDVRIPKSVEIYSNSYYEPYFPENICENGLIKRTDIIWLNKTGYYEISFRLPKAVQRVFITTNCGYCDQIPIYLENKSMTINVQYGYPECGRNNEDISGNFEVINKQIKLESASLNERMNSKDINFNYSQEIKKADQKALQKITQSIQNTEAKDNSSLISSYEGYWYVHKAKFIYDLALLDSCVKKENKMLTKFNNSCYIPEFKAYDRYQDSNNAFEQYSKYYAFSNSPDEIQNLSNLREELRYDRDLIRRINLVKDRCEANFNFMNNSFNFQKPYCERQKLVFNLSIFFWILTFISIGIAIGAWTSWSKEKQ